MSDLEGQNPNVEVVAEVVSADAAPKVISDEAWASATSNWINNHVRNSPISGVVEAWNHLGVVMHHLRQYLEDEIRRTAPPAA